jgi:3-hydroxybutyryl-CoA dehydratase
VTASFTWTCEGVSPEKMKVLALLLGDPNPIHFDARAVRLLGLGERVVNQGPSNIAMVVNVLSEHFPGAKLVRLHTRLLANVFSGDTVTASADVISSETVTGGERIVCAVRLDVAGRGQVIVGEAELFLKPNVGFDGG